MSIILWVNELPNKLLGRVFNMETFNKNAAKMKCTQEIIDAAKKLTEEDEGTLVFKIVGRYFCMIEFKR